MDRPTIHVQIDSIALHGVTHFDGGVFSAALNTELTRLVAESSVRSGGAWNVRGVHIDVGAGVDSGQVGVQVARAIYAQVNGGAES
jgi:hypothetical protein